MKVTPFKTHKITSKDTDIFKILDQYILEIGENSVLAVTSKIISICEGSVVKIDEAIDKDKLIEENSQLFLGRNDNKYNISFTITNNILSASAGIDESNGNGYYILWPKNPQDSVNKIKEYLNRKFNLKRFGVIITDSKTSPLRWGVTGISIAHSGFLALKDYVGKPDLFDRLFIYEKLNIADSIASAAVLVMGEGGEQTPLALIEDLENIEFKSSDPDFEELESMKIKIEDDLYGPFLKNAEWKKGGKNED